MRPPFLTPPLRSPSLARRALCVASAASALGLPAGARAQAPSIDIVEVAGARLELQFAPGFSVAVRGEARDWAERSALAVAGYFGRFPLADTELQLLPIDGAGVKGGTTYGEPSPWVRLRIGRDTTRAQFLADWIMVHEMVHLAIPRIPRSQNWLHEGLATYVEGIARARAGLRPAEQVWREFAAGMPQGLPKADDRGLDHTPTWGRTYWGGAIFCLLADVQIRRRSAHRLGLQDALRGLLAGGASYAEQWSVDRVLATADAAVGQTTLGELHALMKDCPAPVDLDALWRDLGVTSDALRDDAPLAALRRAIVA